ncbi:hypothetical protein GCM10020331_089900 [Ectobacillus funiculus]
MKAYLNYTDWRETNEDGNTKKAYDYIELWKESMTDHNGNIPKRLKDDQAEEDFFWSSMLERKERHKPDPYAKKSCSRNF